MNYFCFVGIRTRDNIVQQSAATAASSPLRHRSHILLLHCLVHLIILRLLHSGSLSDASLLLLVHGETLTQRQALHDFYGATNGGGTAWTSTCSAGGWKAMGTSPPLTFCNNATTSPYSTYYGITCSAPNGRIVALDLASCRLKGTLTASLSALTDLNSLWLNSNELSGTLPPQWSAMSALQNLALNSNQLIGSLPPQWSAMSSLERLWLYSNNLSGMLPPQWPEGMRSVRLTSFFCTASCSGVVGVDANCLGFSPFHCIGMVLWYNCFNTTALPPINSSNPWNWANSANIGFGPQRADCPTAPAPLQDHTQTGTKSLSLSQSHPTTATPTTPATKTVMTTDSQTDRTSTSLSFSNPTGTVGAPSPTGSMIIMPVDGTTSGWFQESVWAGTVSTVGAVVGATLAIATASSAQRAVLQRSLTNCDDNEGSDAPLDISSSPMQLQVGTTPGGRFVRGSVIGNHVLLAALTLLALLLVVVIARCMKKPHKAPISTRSMMISAAATLQLPGLLHVPVLFLLQPTVSGAVWCVALNAEGGDWAIGVLGLLLPSLYVVWATWLVLREAPRRADSVLVKEEVFPFASAIPLPGVMRRAVLGIQDMTTEWQDRRHDDHPGDVGFVQRYGPILCVYRATRQWFISVELLLALLCGVVGGVAQAFPEACGGPALMAVYLALLLSALLGTLLWQPYNEPLDHCMCVASLLLSIAWALCTLAEADVGATDALAAAQTWLGTMTICALAVGLVVSARLRRWLAQRLRLRPRNVDTAVVATREDHVHYALLDVVRQICDAQKQLLSERQNLERFISPRLNHSCRLVGGDLSSHRTLSPENCLRPLRQAPVHRYNDVQEHILNTAQSAKKYHRVIGCGRNAAKRRHHEDEHVPEKRLRSMVICICCAQNDSVRKAEYRK